ncbi:unnamed protein product [Symbiodinium microadriaticum]|nr:unnamed protein product [Symbiodinium microadriaticum]
MWVWRSLGCDQAAELPQSTIAALGRRCCKDRPEAFPSPSPSWLDEGLPGRDSENSVKDSKGESYWLNSARNDVVTAAWRLEPLNNLRLCVPAAVEVRPPGPVQVLEINEKSVKGPGEKGLAFKNVREAVRRLSSRGGGTFCYRVPTAVVQLREEATREVLTTPDQPTWPHCVTSVLVGAMLRVVVSVDSQNSPSPSLPSLPSLPSINKDAEEARSVVIQCESCRLSIVQRGGPLLDPAKLHGCNDEGIAYEFDLWMKRTRSKPNTWRLLSITPEQGAVEDRLVSSLAFNPPPGVLSTHGRQMGDLVLAAVADIEFSIEPFELSYGESHLESLRQMVAEEIANLLGISTEQVMCGAFLLKSVVPKRRHVRRNSMMLQIALLHSGLIEVVRGPQMPTFKPAPALPTPVSPKSKRPALSRSPTAMDSQSLAETGLTSEDTASPAQKPRKSVALTRALTTLKDTEEAFAKTVRGLSASASAPSLHAKSSTQSKAQSTQSTQSQSNTQSLYNTLNFQGREMPPDQLLKMLVNILGDHRHPIRKHPEIFPMFSKITKKAVLTKAPLVASQDIIDASHMAASIRELMQPRKVKPLPSDLDGTSMEQLSTMRTEILKLYAQPGGSIAVQKSQLVNLTPKEILDLADCSFGQLHSLVACLEATIEKTENDVEFCQRLRLHHAVERTVVIMRHFSSNREVVFRGFQVLGHLTKHDLLSVDAILDKSVAPDILLSSDNFPSDQEMQLIACQVLRRVYIRARGMTMAGSRVVTLGKQLEEVWTFHGLARILTSMKLFPQDAEIQLECCVLLASIGELLHNNGYATEVFKILELAMRKHGQRADLVSQGILIIARLGASFLALENRGIRTIVNAMARHRSDKELQKTAVRALFALSKDEVALKASRAGGGVGAIFAAMAGHPDATQVLQEGTRALEKHCPRAVASIARLCGDLIAVLPPVVWSSGPDLGGKLQVHMDVEDLKSHGWAPRGIENFVAEFSPPANDSRSKDEEDLLHLTAGFRRKQGLRDDIDAADSQWMSLGSVRVMMPRSSTHNILQKDINALSGRGCDVEILRQAGPKREHVQGICEVLAEGVGPKKYTAQDGELLVLILGHFAWFSHAHASEIIEFGGHQAIMEWLRTDRFKGQRDPRDDALAFPMQRACLSTLSCLCRHGIDTAGHLLELEAVETAVQFTGHLEAGLRCASLRLLARLLPYAVKRYTGKDSKDSMPMDDIWPPVLCELRSSEEVLRTAAATCAVEAINSQTLPTDPQMTQNLAQALLHALDAATLADSAAGALPVLIAVSRMVSDTEDEYASTAIKSCDTLIPLLTDWLPKATRTCAVSTAKAAGLAAATTLRNLSDGGAAFGGPPVPHKWAAIRPLGQQEANFTSTEFECSAELAAILRYGTSVSAEHPLQEACKAAIELAVQREPDASLLVQMLTGRLRLGASGEEKIADLTILIRIAQRAVVLIKQDPNQATESLLMALEDSSELIQEIPPDLPGDKDMDGILKELTTLTSKSIGLADGSKEEGAGEEPASCACSAMYQPWSQPGIAYAPVGGKANVVHGYPVRPGHPGPGYPQPIPQPVPPVLQPVHHEGRPHRPSTQLREISLEYSYAELSESTSNWHDSRRLGSGSYGSVYKGELEDGSEVAIKAIDLGALGASGTAPEMAGFEEEVQMLSKFRHPNLVTLLGWGKHDSGSDRKRYLVYELLSGGDCFQRLQKSKKPSANSPFLWFERLSVCLDAAAGLSHMLNSKPKAFHRDIKSANILLDRHGTAKMADFGLSCTSSHANSLHVTVRTISGTPGYACPIYSRTGRVTEGSEVHSLGMVMLELLTGLAPATADPTRPGGIAYQVADAISQHSPGALERCLCCLDANAGWPKDLAKEMAELALRAVHSQEEERPRFVELVRTLRRLLERFPKPIQSVAMAVPPPTTPAASPTSPENEANPKAREAKAQAVIVHSSQAAFGLEFVTAVGVDLNTLPPDVHRLCLAGTILDGVLLVPVGRSHQQRAFEAWVPDQRQNCISRTAFEIACGTKGENAMLTVRGSGLISVDGKVAPRETGIPLSSGAEIAFHHGADMNSVLLRLRFVPGEILLESERREKEPEKEEKERAEPGSPRLLQGLGREPSSPCPRRAVREDLELSPSHRAKDTNLNSGPSGGTAGTAGTWILACVHVEGLSPSRLADLPSAVRDIQVPSALLPLMLGRIHQNQFEALAKAADKPKLGNFISRTHGQLDTDADGLSLCVTNLSSNPLYVGEELVAQSQTVKLARGQLLCFARPEQDSGNHIHFLKFKAILVEGGHGPTSPLRGQDAPNRAAAHLSPQRSVQVRRTVVEGAEAPHLLTLSPPPRKVNPDASTSPNRVSRIARERIDERPAPICLELSGDGVLDVPASERRIGPVSVADQPMIVGRKHQPELHKRAVNPQCLKFMSRDHFSISCERGLFRIEPLTSNPMWRFRVGLEPLELEQQKPAELRSGDRVALGTGSDNSPEAALQSLCWLFTEGADPTKVEPMLSIPRARTPPSPGGAFPRVSEDKPWAIRVLRTQETSAGLDSPASPARERLLSESGAPKAKAKSRPLH